MAELDLLQTSLQTQTDCPSSQNQIVTLVKASAFTSKSRQKSPIAAEKEARFVACRCFEKKSPKGSEK